MFKHAKKNKKAELLKKRKKRIRSKISGTAERPRLSVFRSTKHVYVQVIDDKAGKTLAQASSFEKELKSSANVDGCKDIGKRLAERCIAQNIQSVVFDKNGKKYHGRVKAIADSARENGLKF